MNGLATAATQALLNELETSPKPGLVDRESNGAHTDLSVDRLRESALALQVVFHEIALSAAGAEITTELREEVGAIGRRGESAMWRASGGTNTHRGALWALGLLVASAAALKQPRSPYAIAAHAGKLARLHDRFAGYEPSHGRTVQQRYGAGGARAEAAAGFPHVISVALPALRAGAPQADVLLELLARVDDTCLLHRGGPAGRAHCAYRCQARVVRRRQRVSIGPAPHPRVGPNARCI